jgi:hypothetical protein
MSKQSCPDTMQDLVLAYWRRREEKVKASVRKGISWRLRFHKISCMQAHSALWAMQIAACRESSPLAVSSLTPGNGR